VEKLRRVPAWAWALLFSVLLCLPGLWSFGLWEPWELNVAERARRAAEAGLSFSEVAGSFARGELTATLQALGTWMKRNRQPPSMQAFHDTGVGIPAVYVHALYDALRSSHPEHSEADVIRLCELDIGSSFMRHVKLTQ